LAHEAPQLCGYYSIGYLECYGNVIEKTLSENRWQRLRKVLGIVPLSGPWATVPELFFDKKQLISALQQLLISYQTWGWIVKHHSKL